MVSERNRGLCLLMFMATILNQGTKNPTEAGVLIGVTPRCLPVGAGQAFTSTPICVDAGLTHSFIQGLFSTVSQCFRRCSTRISHECVWRVPKSTGVITLTLPVMARARTVVVISELEATLKVAEVPLNVALVAPVRSVPRILTGAPTLPAMGSVSTNGQRPTALATPIILLLNES